MMEEKALRDLWLICEKSCCEQPCLIYIEGGGQRCERQQKYCVLGDQSEKRLEWWRPLTQKDIEDYEIDIRPMDGYLK